MACKDLLFWVALRPSAWTQLNPCQSARQTGDFLLSCSGHCHWLWTGTKALVGGYYLQRGWPIRSCSDLISSPIEISNDYHSSGWLLMRGCVGDAREEEDLHLWGVVSGTRENDKDSGQEGGDRTISHTHMGIIIIIWTCPCVRPQHGRATHPKRRPELLLGHTDRTSSVNSVSSWQVIGCSQSGALSEEIFIVDLKVNLQVNLLSGD